MTTAIPARIRPTTVDEVQEALGTMAEEERSVLVVGGGSEAVTLPLPDVDVLIELAAVRGIVDHQPDDLTVTVLPGTTLADLDDELAASGQTAVLPDGAPHRTVGGIVGAGLSGPRRLRYGPTRDRVIGVEVATGYGRRVRGGGRLVKNVTGYDLPRLATGSRGALGIITEVTFKLLPVPRATVTVQVDDAPSAASTVYRPSAVLETHHGSFVYLEGSEHGTATAASALGGTAVPGFRFPDPFPEPFGLSVRVPARHLGRAVARVEEWGATSWTAHHGVGLLDVGIGTVDVTSLSDMRATIGELGGVVVVERWPTHVPLHDRFGHHPATGGVEDRLRGLFDPRGILVRGSRWVMR